MKRLSLSSVFHLIPSKSSILVSGNDTWTTNVCWENPSFFWQTPQSFSLLLSGKYTSLLAMVCIVASAVVHYHNKNILCSWLARKCNMDSVRQNIGIGVGRAQFETTHRVVSNLYKNLWKFGGGAHAPSDPPAQVPMPMMNITTAEINYRNGCRNYDYVFIDRKWNDFSGTLTEPRP